MRLLTCEMTSCVEPLEIGQIDTPRVTYTSKLAVEPQKKNMRSPLIKTLIGHLAFPTKTSRFSFTPIFLGAFL
ncbi:hypothetical protein PUN4_1070032 [Paraburkholderia unamae]|nr:hypothetical protein PUN4_1070032 [Paraburkholderia unamae]